MRPIERAARALAEQQSARWDAADFTQTPGGEEPEEMREGFREMARTVLLAVREPSEGMKTAGGMEGFGFWSEEALEGSYCGELAKPVFQAMIDAALAE